MKKIISLLLTVLMAVSCFGILSYAEDPVTLYKDGEFEFILDENGGALITKVDAVQVVDSQSWVSFPFRLCYDDDKIIGTIELNGIEQDDNDAPDPFGKKYALVTGLSSSAFDPILSDVTAVHISKNLTDFSINAFTNLPNLTMITVNEENQQYSAHNGSLYSADGTVFKYHPRASTDNTILSSVTTIESGAFAGSTALQSISIPEQVITIPQSCFDSCTALTSLDLTNSNVQVIDYWAFANSGLERVSLGATIKSVSSFAFYNCASLAELIVPQEASDLTLDSASFLGAPLSNLLVYRSITQMPGNYSLGYYYDDEFQPVKYADFSITSYRYNEDRTAATALYEYAAANGIAFNAFETYTVTVNNAFYLAGREAEMGLYIKKNKIYSATSSTGIFTIENVEPGTYNIYYESEFGTRVSGGSIDVSLETMAFEISENHTAYAPKGDVNNDGKINVDDIAYLLQTGVYGCANTARDIDKDGYISISDISVIVNKKNYGQTNVTISGNSTPIEPL